MTGFQWDWGYVWTVIPHLLEGLKITVTATILGSIGAFTLGLIWTALRLANIPIISPLVNLWVSFIRGTPFLVQLYFVFYVFPNYGITLSAMMSGVIGLSLFYSAPVSEVYRAGIEGVAPGQWEASLTLGLPISNVWCRIVLPQAFRTVTPMLGNTTISMFKETALLSTITIAELMAQAMDIAMAQYRFIEPLTMVGLLYFCVSYISAKGVRGLEKWSHARV